MTLHSISETITRNELSLEIFIVIVSTVFAVFLTAFRFYPQLATVLFPYYKQGSSLDIGFLPLRYLIKTQYKARAYAFKRILIPMFQTCYVFGLLTADFLLEPNLAYTTNYFYMMTTFWLIIMLATGSNFIKLLPLSAVIAIIGYFSGGSVFGAYIGALLPFALYFAVGFDDNFVFTLFTKKIEYEKGYTLTGKKLSKWQQLLRQLSVKPFIVWGQNLFILILVIMTIIFAFADLFDYGIPDFIEGFLTNAGLLSSRIGRVLLVLAFLNVSLRMFGGIFDYLQLDFFKELGNLLRLFKEQPENDLFQKINQDSSEADTKTASPLNNTDTVINLEVLKMEKFLPVLYYSSFDIMLTSIALFGLYNLPGLSSDQTMKVAFLFKLPTLILLSFRSLQVFVNLCTHTGKMNSYYLGLENFLAIISEQQKTKNKYINIVEENLVMNQFILERSQNE